MTDENARPNPAGRSEIEPHRPERPRSRHPPARPVSRPVTPFTDWSFLTDNEVISIPSKDDDDYVPRSQTLQDQLKNQRTRIQDQITMNLVLPELYFPMFPERPMKKDLDLLLAEEPSCRGFPPFKGIRTEKKTAVREDKANVKCY